MFPKVQARTPMVGRRPEDIPAEIWLIAAGVIVVAVVVGLVLHIFFLRTLSRTLRLCHPHNRRINPGHVWFNLIPLVVTFWLPLTILRVTETLRKEYRDRGLPADGDHGRAFGLAFAFLALLGSGAGYIEGTVGYVVSLAGSAALAFWTAYWVRVAQNGRTLADDDNRPRTVARPAGRDRIPVAKRVAPKPVPPDDDRPMEDYL